MWVRRAKLLFSFCDRTDTVLVSLGSICALTAGVGYLAFDYLMWATIGKAVGTTRESTSQTLVDMGYFLLAMAIALLTTLSASEWLMRVAASRRCDRMRTQLTCALLAKSIDWFETQPEAVHAEFLFLRDSVQLIETGIGLGFQQCMFFVSICLGGFVVCFVFSPQLSLVLLGTMPVIVIGMGVVTRFAVKAADMDQAAFSSAAGVAMRTLRDVKTVHSCQQERSEFETFQSRMFAAKSVTKRTALFTGLGQMASQGMAVIDIGIGLWFMAAATQAGTAHPVLDGSTLVWVLTTMIYGGLALGYSTEGLTALTAAVDLIEQVGVKLEQERLRRTSQQPLLPQQLDFDRLELRADLFTKSALSPTEASLFIPRGEHIAVVAPNTMNKRSVAAAVCAGNLLVNSVPLKRIQDWKSIIAYVSHEPGLFHATVKENLLIGSSIVPSEEELLETLNAVGLSKFLGCLPRKLDAVIRRGEFPPMTLAQERQLALARALLRSPKILVLDRVTDGLPSEDEQIVRMAVRMVRARLGKATTVICVSDEYRGLDSFNRVLVLDGHGAVVQDGPHAGLLEDPDSLYVNLLKKNDPDLLLSGSAGDLPPVEEIPSIIPHEDPSPCSRLSIRSEAAIVRRPVPMVQSASFSWKRTMLFSKPFWHSALVAGIAGAAIAGCVPPIVIYILARLTEIFDEPNVLDNVEIYIIILFGLGGMMAVGCFVREYAFGRITEGTVARIRLTAMRHILAQPIDLYEAGNTPESILSSMWRRCYAAGYITSMIINSVTELVAWFVVAVVIGFVATWEVAAVSVSSMLLLMAAYYVFYRYLPPEMPVLDSVELIGDALSSVRTFKFVDGEQHVGALFTAALAAEQKGRVWNAFVLALFSSIPFSICPLLTSFGFWYSGLMYTKTTNLTLANVLQTTYAIGDAGELAMYVISWLPDFGKLKRDTVRVMDLLDNDFSFDKGELDFSEEVQKIALHRVTFAFSSTLMKQVLFQATLEVHRGQLVGLVGPFKSGKSAILNLVQRFYDPQYGKVLINDHNVRDFTIDSVRRVQAYAGQHPVLMEGSYRYNVLYGTKNYTEPELESLRIKFSLDFVIDWDEPVTPDLSLDHMQRLCIARAYARKPQILLLDEPFTLLDREVASSIRILLETERSSRITIIATTNPRRVINADRIYVIDAGQVVQSGTHADLLEDHDGIYFKMN